MSSPGAHESGAGAVGVGALEAIAVRLAGQARPGEEIEAYVARGRETEVVVYEASVESLSTATSEGVGIRVIVDHRQGFAYAGSLDPEIVDDTLQEARDNAGFATPDEYLGLASPDGVEAPSLDLWREALESFPTDAKVELALELERRVHAGDSRIRSLRASSYGDSAVEASVATSTGIRSRARRTACFVSAEAIAGEADDTQTGYGFSVGRSPEELSLERAAGDAVERATRLLGARKPASARLTVVFEPEITSTLLSILAGTLSGEAVLKGRSLFADRVGEPVTAAGITLVDDPTDARAYAASAYDAEGLACRRNLLVDDGTLRGYLYNTYAGRRAGVPSTASAVRAGFKGAPGVGARALSLVPGSKSQEEILAAVGTGLLVQSVAGIHSGVNPVSGDFSVGAEGLMFHDGALAEPVREITIASTIQRMLLGILHVGADLEWLPGNAAGMSLAIADVSMSGS